MRRSWFKLAATSLLLLCCLPQSGSQQKNPPSNSIDAHLTEDLPQTTGSDQVDRKRRLEQRDSPLNSEFETELLQNATITNSSSSQATGNSSLNSEDSGQVASGQLIDGPVIELNAIQAANFGYWRHSPSVSVILTVAYTMVFVVGIVGNSFVVAIVCKSPRMRTVTNYFIANLAFADILVLLFCLPATLVSNLFFPYVLGLFVCKTVSYLQGVAVSASINTMVAVTMDRFLAICFPMDWHMSRRTARWTIACIWLFSLSISMPWALYFTLVPFPFDNRNIYVCSEDWPSERMGTLYFVCANLILLYLLPATVIILCYLGIWYKIERRNIPGDRPKGLKIELIMQRSKLKVVKMMMVVVVIFLLSWLPLYLIFARIKLVDDRSPWEEWLIPKLMPLAQWLGASNSCINPILYTFFNRKYKRGFIDLLRFGFCCGPAANLDQSLNGAAVQYNNTNVNNNKQQQANIYRRQQQKAQQQQASALQNGARGHGPNRGSASDQRHCRATTNCSSGSRSAAAQLAIRSAMGATGSGSARAAAAAMRTDPLGGFSGNFSTNCNTNVTTTTTTTTDMTTYNATTTSAEAMNADCADCSGANSPTLGCSNSAGSRDEAGSEELVARQSGSRRHSEQVARGRRSSVECCSSTGGDEQRRYRSTGSSLTRRNKQAPRPVAGAQRSGKRRRRSNQRGQAEEPSASYSAAASSCLLGFRLPALRLGSAASGGSNCTAAQLLKSGPAPLAASGSLQRAAEEPAASGLGETPIAETTGERDSAATVIGSSDQKSASENNSHRNGNMKNRYMNEATSRLLGRGIMTTNEDKRKQEPTGGWRERSGQEELNKSNKSNASFTETSQLSSTDSTGANSTLITRLNYEEDDAGEVAAQLPVCANGQANNHPIISGADEEEEVIRSSTPSSMSYEDDDDDNNLLFGSTNNSQDEDDFEESDSSRGGLDNRAVDGTRRLQAASSGLELRAVNPVAAKSSPPTGGRKSALGVAAAHIGPSLVASGSSLVNVVIHKLNPRNNHQGSSQLKVSRSFQGKGVISQQQPEAARKTQQEEAVSLTQLERSAHRPPNGNRAADPVGQVSGSENRGAIEAPGVRQFIDQASTRPTKAQFNYNGIGSRNMSTGSETVAPDVGCSSSRPQMVASVRNAQTSPINR